MRLKTPHNISSYSLTYHLSNDISDFDIEPNGIESNPQQSAHTQSRPLVENHSICPGDTRLLGFICTSKALGLLAKDPLLSDKAGLEYLLTFRISQDHLESFFGLNRLTIFKHI